MNLAVSNIAWPAEDRAEAYSILSEYQIKGLEIAPGLFLPDSEDAFRPTAAEADAALKQVSDAGLTLVSMQSLLFGTQGAALFGTDAEREALVKGMERAIGLARVLGIPNLVFGSPKQRIIPDGMAEDEAMSVAADVFSRLGDLALEAGTVIGMESNPEAYGTNFINTIEQCETFVRHVNHPGIRINYDIGAMHMNGAFQDVPAVSRRIADMVSHVHISEPNLDPAPARVDDAQVTLSSMMDTGYDRWFSIEMKRTQTGACENLRACVSKLVAAADQVVGR